MQKSGGTEKQKSAEMPTEEGGDGVAKNNEEKIYENLKSLEEWAIAGISQKEMAEMLGPVLAVAALGSLLVIVVIAALVVRYMALYDIYVSCDPANSVLFLVLSILFGITEPFFLFFSRNKDQGMPPRKTVYEEPPLEGEVVY